MQHWESQHSLKREISCTGVGLHSGADVCLTLRPADADTGIVFVRTDVEAAKAVIPAAYHLVKDTRLGTSLVNDHGTGVSTIEHLMAALWGCGVDNVVVELDSPEVPIMDGSSEPFMFLIESAGLRTQDAPRRAIKITRPVTVHMDDATLTLEPHDGFAMDVEIDFAHKAIARQHAVYDFSNMTFRQMLSRARTFGFAHEVEQLRKLGLARGGSLKNAVVIGEEGVLNAEGLRFSDEFVRHKALDCIGDLLLAGAPIIGRVVARRPGHGINNKALHALFADRSAWEYVTLAEEAAIPAAYGAGNVSVGTALCNTPHE